MSAVRSRISRRVFFLTRCAVSMLVLRSIECETGLLELRRDPRMLGKAWGALCSCTDLEERCSAQHSDIARYRELPRRNSRVGPFAVLRFRLHLLPLVLPLCTYLCWRRNADSYIKSATSISPNSSCPPCSPTRMLLKCIGTQQ